MIENLKLYLIRTLDDNLPGHYGYLTRSMSGKYAITEDPVQAVFIHTLEEAEEIISYVGPKLKLNFYVKPVQLSLTDETQKAVEIPKESYRALLGLRLGLVRANRKLPASRGPEDEAELLRAGLEAIEGLAAIYRQDTKFAYKKNFETSYNGYHIAALPGSEDHYRSLHVRDYSKPGRYVDFELVKSYSYLTHNEKDLRKTIRKAKIYIDHLNAEAKRKKYL